MVLQSPEAGVTQLRDLLRKQLHSGHGVAKDDCLVDLQLGEEGVEAVNLCDAISNNINWVGSGCLKLVTSH